jgi:acyl carrier protein phosphodiesterase
VRQTRNRLDPAWRHWRGVLVDVFYDHFLARDFEAHTGEARPATARATAHVRVRRASPQTRARDYARDFPLLHPATPSIRPSHFDSDRV